MKKILLALAFLSLLVAGCSKAYDDSAIKQRIDNLETLVRDNTQAIARLQEILDDASAKGLTLTVTPVEGGNLLTFSDGTSVIVLDGEKGDKGDQGDRGDKGDPGTPGQPGSDATISIEESTDGSSYIITAGDKQYTIRKGQTFALKLTTTEVQLGVSESVEIPYTLTDGDETTHVFIATQAGGYTARVDEAGSKVVVTAPAVLPDKGFIVVTASKNSTSEMSSQYVSFLKGTLEVVADTELVEAEGGTVTLTVTADSDYSILIPEDCTWARQVSTKGTVTTTEAYIKVDKNTTTEARSVTVTVHSPVGDRLIVIAQKAGQPEAQVIILTPEDANDKIAAIAAMTAEEIEGATIRFTEGTYSLSSPLTLNFSGSELVKVTIEGENAVIESKALTLTGVDARVSGLTIQKAATPVRITGTAELKAKLALVKCNISANSGTGMPGSAVSIANGDVSIEDCTFSDNKGTYGGSIFMNKSQSTLLVKGCTFSGNRASYGADIYMVNGDLTVEDCHFTASTGTYSGGVLAMSSANQLSSYYDNDWSHSKAVLKNCSFKEIMSGSASQVYNDDGPSGAISCLYGDLNLDGCVFDGCEGKGGTAVTMGSSRTNGAQQRGNGILKMDNCIVKDCSNTRLGLIYLWGGGWKASQNRYYVFVNNTSFYDNSSSTGDFGTIAHSGGDGGVIMMNNCTVYKEIVPESSENGFAFNTDGFILISNSTLVTETSVGLLRNGNGNGSVKFINSIGINTGTKNANAKEFGFTGTRFGSGSLGDDARNVTTDGHCIIGPSYSSANTFTDPVLNATTASLDGFKWNAATGLIEWNGPAAGFSKLSASDFQASLTGFGPGSASIFGETASAGDAFYNWLNEIGATGKDARGNSRGSSWWPGAYQN